VCLEPSDHGGGKLFAVCNLYSITINQAAISALFRVVNRHVGNLARMPGLFPDYKALFIRTGAQGRETRDRALGHAVVVKCAHGGHQKARREAASEGQVRTVKEGETANDLYAFRLDD
jgi:hypothetical protein